MAEDYEALDEDNRIKWDAAHEAHHHGALSGSDPQDVFRNHRIVDCIRPGLVVLDIGVGLGGMSKHLHSVGCTVDALDVSEVAESAVRPYVRRFYLARNIECLPSGEYDLAISQLVAQHMCERNLRIQIREVFRSLKPGGLFSLHLAGATEGPLNNLADEIPAGMDGAMCRTEEYALAMISDVLVGQGYVAALVDHRMDWPQFKSYWYFIHVTKNLT